MRQFLAQREANAGAFHVRMFRAESAEGIEQRFLFGFGNAVAVVDDPECNRVAERQYAQGH